MITFEYQGLNTAGQNVRGLIEANNAKHARAILSTRNILAETITPVAKPSAKRQRVTISARAMFYHELALLLQAGLPLTEALEVLLKMPDFARFRPTLAAMRDQVRGGENLADAVAAAWHAHAEERALITAGEQTANLGPTLKRMADFLDQQHYLRERAATALLYPALVAGLAALISIGLLGVALPRFGRMMADAHITLPALTRVMLKIGDLIIFIVPVLAIIALLTYWILRQRLAANPQLRRNWSRYRLSAPLMGAGASCLAALKFTRAMEMLLAGGVAVVDALPLAGAATNNSWLTAEVGAAAEAVRHGATLTNALKDIPALAAPLSGWLEVGEAGGMLEQVLRSAGDRLQRQWERIMARRMALLEPALILLVGLVVLLVALAVLLPITQLNQLVL